MQVNVPDILAQQDAPFVRIAVWAAVLIAVLVVLFILAQRIRKWSRSDSQLSAHQGFTLSDLRRMHAQGQLSDEELDRAKARVAARAQEEILSRSPQRKDSGPLPPDKK